VRIAIIGTGVSGLVAAYLLHEEHDLVLYEAQSHVGGHTLTTNVTLDGGEYAVDAGFIVYNEANYPNFVRLLDDLGIETQPTTMSFSVKSEASGLEYAGSSLGTLFAQRRNLVNPGFLRMLVDILRFNRAARRALNESVGEETIGDFLRRGRYSRQFVDHYLVAMTAAIWSTDPQTMRSVPAEFLLKFLHNHGLLAVDGQFPWRVVTGGSRTYVERLIAPFRESIRLRCPVRAIERRPDQINVATASGSEPFDEVIVATHSDQALELLADPTPSEREVLGAIPYQVNDAALHTDDTVLPRRQRAWASWNYLLPAEPSERVAVTYNMSELQRLESPTPLFVSLNMTDRLDPAKVIRTFSFSHPLFTSDAVAAQRRHSEISGSDRIHYCGAYWRNGFHEDGVVSALEVGKAFGKSLG
jgi:predicted NAD/FAD-binding protein